MEGKLIIIESGTDSCGKATQTKKLYNRLIKEGYRVRKVEYPNYKSDSSALIKMYLNGQFGDQPEDVNAYAASTFYGVDRYASFVKDWKSFYEEGGIIIADRYTTSNMVHQASKIDDIDKREEYLQWLWDLEFNKFQLPIPNAVIFLDMPPSVSSELMKNRNNKFTGEADKDIHEKNDEYLMKTYDNACWIAKKYKWNRIDSTKEDQLKSIEEIHEEIYEVVIGTLSCNDER